jgi:hypothetical protein
MEDSDRRCFSVRTWRGYSEDVALGSSVRRMIGTPRWTGSAGRTADPGKGGK